MPRRLVLLALGVMIAAMAVIEVRHHSRVRYAELQSLQAERDRLNTQWGRLLLEEGAWSQHRRIEQTARQRLGMELPGPEDIVVVRATGEDAQ